MSTEETGWAEPPGHLTQALSDVGSEPDGDIRPTLGEALAAPTRVEQDATTAKTLITPALLAEVGRRLYEYENTIDWHTSCTSCARVLDSATNERERAERAKALLERVLHLRMNGERAPGGTETWRDLDRDIERYLRGLLP